MIILKYLKKPTKTLCLVKMVTVNTFQNNFLVHLKVRSNPCLEKMVTVNGIQSNLLTNPKIKCLVKTVMVNGIQSSLLTNQKMLHTL